MNGLVYAKKHSGSYGLFSFADQREQTATDYQALLMSRLDFDVKVTELPRLPAREVEGFLQYRIRSLYPGHPEETVFDYRMLTYRNMRYAVIFLAHKGVLEEYHALAGGKPMLLPFNLFMPYFARYQDAVYFFWHPDWIELFLLQPGGVVSSLVLRRGRAMAGDFSRLRTMIGETEQKPNWVFLCTDREEGQLRLQAERQAGHYQTLDFVPIQSAFQRTQKKRQYLFREKKKKRIVPPRLRIQLFLFVVLLLGSLLFRKSVGRLEGYAGRLHANLGSFEQSTAQLVSLRTEGEALEEQLGDLLKRRPIDPYRVLGELKDVMDDGSTIQSFILETDLFQIEALGPNPLLLMEKFKDRDLFRDVKLMQIVPVSGSANELFRITGRLDVK